MYIRFYNARILTMRNDDPIFEGEIHVLDDHINYVGKSFNTEGLSFDKEIDCEGNLLMPGFKNAHTHSGMSMFRSLADDLPLDEWLNIAIFPKEAKMTDEDIYTLSKLSVLEYLTSGITACFDMYLTPVSIAKSMDDMEFRCVQVGAMNNFSQSLELIEECYLKLNEDKESLQSYILGFHAEYTTSLELMKGLANLAQKYKAPVYTHLAETKAEVDGCYERYGMSPLALMDSIGMFNYGGGIYHGVYLNDDDLEIIKKRNMYVVINSASNAKLASGITDINKYLKHGINMAIGTDGPASNNSLDMFKEMFLTSTLSKVTNNDASAVDSLEILKMATVNGAHAMGLDDCDTIANGKKADIIMINLNMPNMQPLNNIRKNLVYSGSKINVKMTMINGKILYMDGKFYTKDTPEDIYKEVEKIKNRIVNE